MSSYLKPRLQLMMFMQFFVWGSWYATAGNYMRSSGLSDVIYLAYMASPIGSVVAPFFLGMIADRLYSIQKVMGVMHLLSGVFVFFAPFVVGGSMGTTWFLTFLLLHMLCYMPTLGLATATAFHMLPNRESEFPLIRVAGSIGWIAAGILVSYFLQSDDTGLPMRIAGVAGVLLGLYSFTLPNVPPPAKVNKTSFRDIMGLDAFSKLGSRKVMVFLACILLTSIPLATYYAYVPVYLSTAGITNPAFKMTFGQMSEVAVLLLLPWFLARFGVKWVVIIGMFAWVLRYGLFAIGASGPATGIILIGIVLHGFCYDFVYIAGQIYLDKMAPVTVRAQAQGLFVLVSYGIGQGLGTLIAGWAFNNLVTAEGTLALPQWQVFWIIPLAFSGIVSLLFLFASGRKE